MGEVQLPQEILHQIFLQLDGRSTFRCRAVCRSWRDAVDSLSHVSWRKICINDPSHLDCATIKKKSGLPWRDTFRALHSWEKVHPWDMKTFLLCQDVTEFKVLPTGLIACMITKKVVGFRHLSDTIIYFNTETSQRVDEQHFDFNFLPTFYNENEHLQVFVVEGEEVKQDLKPDLRLCVMVKKTRIKYFIDDYILTKYNRLEATFIGKEFYFRKSRSDVEIYCSKLTNDEILETNFVGNIKFEGDFIVDAPVHIKQFVLKDGDLYIHCGEESEIFILKYQNSEFVCIYGTSDLFIEACFRTLRSDYGFHWLEDNDLLDFFYIEMFSDYPLYSNGIVMLRYIREENSLRIYNVTRVTYYEDLITIIQDDKDVICTISLDEIVLEEHKKFIQLDIDVVETSGSNKILISTEHKLYVFELSHVPQKTVTKRMDRKESGPETSKKCKTQGSDD